MPSPVSPPPGCHFSPRCPRVHAPCKTVYPAERALSESHTVRCHLYGDDAAARHAADEAA
jgi:peptide/nickel transport system ATP-binding protein